MGNFPKKWESFWELRKISALFGTVTGPHESRRAFRDVAGRSPGWGRSASIDEEFCAVLRSRERDLGRGAELDKGVGGRRHIQEPGVEVAGKVFGERAMEAYTGGTPRR